MKLNRLLTASLLGFSLLTTSALASEHNSNSNSQSQSSSEESHWSFLGWCHHFTDSHQRECDQNGQDSGRGNNCDRGKGNGGGYCSATGSSSGSGGSTTGKGIGG